MAKDKLKEALYKIEGKRRIQNRKKLRKAKFAVKQEYNRQYRPWEDSTSPTGYSQMCSWQGICQYPCNGDC